MTIIYLFALVMLVAAVGGVIIYNRLVKYRNLVEEGLSGIDVQLKRRSNLIPNLVTTVKGYAGHEKEVLDRITRLRAESIKASRIKEKGAVEGQLSGALNDLFAVVENYPELKADTNFLDLQKSLTEIEDQIQLARRYYNGAVRNLNILVESFPSNLVARLFGYCQAEFFTIDDAAEREVPAVDLSAGGA